MKLYHFCPEHMLPGIKKGGLTKGNIPLITKGKVRLLPKIQWLTLNPSFDQEWEKYSSLPYRRNDYRITLKIPKLNENLGRWLSICQHPIFKETAEILNEYGDPENWFIYKGRIRPGLFRDIIAREK